MKILNLGSINIDHVYNVEHFVRPGETISGLDYNIFAGGKGFNQSIALARAGATTIHAGKVGKNSEWLLRQLEQDGADINHISTDTTATGHAVIQVSPSGENAIVLYGGANQCITPNDITSAVDRCSPGDYLLTQNETSAVADAIKKAHEKELRIAFNPAPMNATIHDYPLELVDIFILNETEAEGLTGKTNPQEIQTSMLKQYPDSATVLTLGSKGAIYFDKDSTHHETAASVNAIDTTAAGDTFIGFFLAELMQSNNPAKALKQGCHAAGICVTRAGASNSIPTSTEINS